MPQRPSSTGDVFAVPARSSFSTSPISLGVALVAQAAQNNTCDGQPSSSDLPHSPCRRSGTLGQPLAAKPHQGKHPSKAPRTHSRGSHRCGRKQKCSTHLVMSFGKRADVLGITAEVLSKHQTRCPRYSFSLVAGGASIRQCRRVREWGNVSVELASRRGCRDMVRKNYRESMV